MIFPVPADRTYFNSNREWREEFIYFLLVDRFADAAPRTPAPGTGRCSGSGTPAQLSQFCGGKLSGITSHLDYIQGLGCSALWLSPIFENNDASSNYHGYSIQNYMDVDPRFGTKQDLVDLVAAAHQRNMCVFLDVVLNHSGDNWQYPFDAPYKYFDDQQFPLDAFRRPDRPLPVELRDPAAYHRRGQIQNWDNFPEYQHGDFDSLKDFNNEETPDGLRLIDVLVRMHSWWIREADIDGFRLDTVKAHGRESRLTLLHRRHRVRAPSRQAQLLHLRRAHRRRRRHQPLHRPEHRRRRPRSGFLRPLLRPRFPALLHPPRRSQRPVCARTPQGPLRGPRQRRAHPR